MPVLYPISIAPMLALSNRHARYLWRLLTKQTLLYTEMVHCKALLYGDAERILRFNFEEQPLALQLSGSDPDELARAVKMASNYNFAEINLNVGCPSSRVQAGGFGACLMLESELVAECVSAMKSVTEIPVSVKTRLGVSNNTVVDNEGLQHFVAKVAAVGCNKFIIHARMADLNKTTHQNLRLSLNYAAVYQLKERFPQLEVVINGGIKTIVDIKAHLLKVDGVMIGREAYFNPYILVQFDQLFYASRDVVVTFDKVIRDYLIYAEQQIIAGEKSVNLVKPVMGMLRDMPDAKRRRQELMQTISSFCCRISV